MDVEAGPLGQPGTNFGVLVGAVVVDDQVDVEILRDGLLDLAEEAEELLVPLARPALGQHLPRGHVQGSEQGGGAMADEVVRDPPPRSPGPWAAAAASGPGLGSASSRQRRAPSPCRADSGMGRRCRGPSQQRRDPSTTCSRKASAQRWCFCQCGCTEKVCSQR